MLWNTENENYYNESDIMGFRGIYYKPQNDSFPLLKLKVLAGLVRLCTNKAP